MRDVLKMTGLAALVALGTGFAAGPVMAQDFGIRIGPDRPRVERRIYREERPYVERRIVRPAPRRTVCTTRWRDARRVEVCRSGGGGPRW